MKIGNIQLKNNLALAPLAGITNSSYRELMAAHGAGLVVSEMISDYALIYNNKKTFDMVKTTAEEGIVALQLFGGSEESILKAIPILESHARFDILDLNFGCPVPKVIKSHAGSSWLLREEELGHLLVEVVKLSKHPVTIKIRTGFDKEHINAVKIAKLAELAGVSAIAIHGRTRSQFYEGDVDYQTIKDVANAVKIPVYGNGNVTDYPSYLHMMELGATGVMIGRGALGNPRIFEEIEAGIKGQPFIPSTITEQMQFLKAHYEGIKRDKDEFLAVREIRGLATFYLKGFPGAKEYKNRLTRISSEEEFYSLLDEIKKNLS